MVTKRLNKVVQQALVELFMHVADAVDGSEELPDHIRDTYLDAMKKPEVSGFYGRLVDKNNDNL